MPNPVEKLVALVKSGDKRVLLGGAAVIGGGIGLVVFLHSRGSGGTVTALPNQAAGVPEGSGGGGGGSQSSLLGDLGTTGTSGAGDFGVGQDNINPTLPVLPSVLPVPTLNEPLSASNLANTSPIPTTELSSSPLFGALPSLPTLEQPASYTGGSYGGVSALSVPEISGTTGGKFGTLTATQPTPTPILETKPVTTSTATQSQISQFADSVAAAQLARQAYLAQEEQKQSLAAYATARQSVSDALAQQAILSQYTQAAQSQLQSYGAARQSVSAALPVSNLQVYNPAAQSNLAAYGAARQSVSDALAQQGILQQYAPPIVSNLQSYGAARQSVSNYYQQQAILNQYQPQQVQAQQSYANIRQSVSTALQPTALPAAPLAPTRHIGQAGV